MRADFLNALAAAEEQRDSSGRISIIKRAVREEVRSVDPAVNVRFTDYFNSSIAPDMVLEWPKESKDRLLFVRSNSSAEWLLRDLRFVAPHHPLVFTLEDFSEAGIGDALESSPSQSLDNAAAEANTWITSASGTEAISEVRASSLPLGLLGQAMVRGGRGISDRGKMRQLATDTQSGFTGATSLSFNAIRSAVTAIERNLDEEQSGRLTRLLRAAWEGSGGDSATFPSTSTIGNLTADDLSYILSITSDGSERFWRSIGRTINTELIARAQVEDPSPNLNALVSANVDTLQAKGLRVVHEPLRMYESEEHIPRWLTARGCLAFRGINWTAYLAARSIEEFPPPDRAPLPSLQKLKQGASVAHASITEVQFGTGDRAVTYESKDGKTVVDDPEINAVMQNLHVTDIHAAEAALPGGGNIGLDFGHRTASGATSAMFQLGSLVRSALPMLIDLIPGEAQSISEAVPDQDTLFPGWPS